MYHIAETMVRWLAPILSFTAEEIWRFLPGEHGESVFLETWHAVPETPSDTIDWPALIQLRSDVVRELEKLRDAGSIGAPLDAEVDVYCAPDEYARFNALGEELRFLFITSEARVHEVSTSAGQRRPRDQHRTGRCMACASSLRVTRSAFAAGIGGRMWGATRSIRSCAGAV